MFSFLSIFNPAAKPKSESLQSISHDIENLVPDEIWAIIFGQLEPCFMMNIFYVNKHFNALAKSNQALAPILLRYDASAVIPKVMEGRYCYQQFTTYYKKQLATIKNPLAKRLFTFIRENDIEQIKAMGRYLLTLREQGENQARKKEIKYDVPENERIDRMLREKTADGISLLTHMNKRNNQVMRDCIFQIYFEQRNSFSYPVAHFFNRLFDTLRISPRSLLCNFEMAAALNQIEVIQYYLTTESDLSTEWALHAAIEHGHRQIVELLLPAAKRRDHVNYLSLPHSKAAEFNQPEIISYLLINYPLQEATIYEVLKHAVRHDCGAAIEAIAPFISADYLLHTLTMHACTNGKINALHALFKCYPNLITAGVLYNDLNELLDAALMKGHIEIFYFLCNKVTHIRYDDSLRSPYCGVLFDGSTSDEFKINVTKTLLALGYKPKDRELQEARGIDKPINKKLLQIIAEHEQTLSTQQTRKASR